MCKHTLSVHYCIVLSQLDKPGEGKKLLKYSAKADGYFNMNPQIIMFRYGIGEGVSQHQDCIINGGKRCRRDLQNCTNTQLLN